MTGTNRFDEFSENFRTGGRGVISDPKKFVTLFFGKGKGGRGSLHPEKFCCKKRNIVFRKKGGGGDRRQFGSFLKIHQICYRQSSLMLGTRYKHSWGFSGKDIGHDGEKKDSCDKKKYCRYITATKERTKAFITDCYWNLPFYCEGNNGEYRGIYKGLCYHNLHVTKNLRKTFLRIKRRFSEK